MRHIMIRERLHDAFTKISALDKKTISQFLVQQSFPIDLSSAEVQESLEYAVKERPSFGGFVLSAIEEEEIVGALIVNRTGMGGFNPSYLLVHFGIHPKYKQNGLPQRLLSAALRYTKGDLAMRLPVDHPQRSLIEAVGFKAAYLEMRFDKSGFTDSN